MELLFDLLLAFALAMIVGKLFEELFVRLGLPPVIGDLVAGLILGRSLLQIFPVNDTIEAFAWFGIVLLLFYAGLETKYREFMRSLGLYGAITVGEGLAAFSLGYLVGSLMGYPPKACYFLGAVLEATSISVSVRTLIDIGKLATPEGYAILGVAVLDDLVALIIIVAGTSLIKLGTFSVTQLAIVASKALAFWLAVVLILHHVSTRYMPRVLYAARSPEASVGIVLGLLCALSFLTKFVGLSPLVAAYATGLALSEMYGIRRISDRVRTIALLFSVMFFAFTAAKLDLESALKPEFIPLYVAMIGAAFAGKLLGGGLTSFLVGFPPIAALRIAVGLFPRAEFCIVAAYVGYSGGLFGPEILLAAVMITLVTNLATPPLLKIVFSFGGETPHVEPRWRRRRR